MPEMEVFDEVSLEIRDLARGRFEVRLVREDGQAEVTEPFSPPFTARKLGSILKRFDPPSTKNGKRKPQGPGPSGLEVGGALFEALLPGRIRRLFDLSRAGVDTVRPDGSSQGLRVRLRLDLEKERMRPLAALPWELLYDPLSRDFYGRSRLRLLVRHLAAPVPSRPLAVTPPLKILAVAASPGGFRELDLDQEIRNLRNVLAGNERLQVTVLNPATLDDLRQALLRDRPHILHFLGHGQFYQKSGEGFLFFEDAYGESAPVGGDLFAKLLKDFPQVRLVVLNACRTAQMARAHGYAPFTSAGAALSLAGVPAVVAMQFKISDPGAIRFSKVFYESLAAGDPVDVATGEGRRELYTLWYRSPSVEWAAPVLFLRARDGHLFDLPSPPEPPATPVAEMKIVTASEPPRDEPQVVGIRSREPLGDRPALTLNLTRHFDDQFIKDLALWKTAVLPELEEFLRPMLTGGRPLLLDFAAHASLAFATGYVLEKKSGLEIAIRQRSPSGGFHDWKPDDGPLPDSPYWRPEDDHLLEEDASDVAVAVALARPVLDDVRLYLEQERLPIRRLLPVTLAPEPSERGVRNGAHALALAGALARRLQTRTIQERRGTLHLFVAGPNAFLFYLGQLAHGLGRIQLYEYDLDSGIPGAYRVGIDLP
jgi:hypothetical protein